MTNITDKLAELRRKLAESKRLDNQRYWARRIADLLKESHP